MMKTHCQPRVGQFVSEKERRVHGDGGRSQNDVGTNDVERSSRAVVDAGEAGDRLVQLEPKMII